MLVLQQNAHYTSSASWYNCCYAGLVQPARSCRAPGSPVVGGCSNNAAALPATGQLETASAPANHGVSSSDISGLKLALAAAAPEEIKSILQSVQHTQLGGGAYTVIISTFGRRGELEKARQVFEYVPLQQRNVWHVTALCSAYANAGDWESAVKQLKQSASEGADHPQLAPNTITYSTVIEACARPGHLDVAVDLFREMVAAGLEPDPVTYAILLTHFSRAADWDKVDSLFEEMHSKGMSARTPIYAGYIRHLCQALNWNRALSLYLIMKELGAEVTAPIYSELLQALSGAGKPCMVAQLLQEAHQDGVPDTMRLLDASLAHLQALGHHDKARTLHDLMLRQGWPPSPAFIPYPDSEHDAPTQWQQAAPAGVAANQQAAPAGVAANHSGAEVSREVVGVVASSNSSRRSSSGGRSVASSCCSFGDAPPAAREAGRGQLRQHDHPTGSPRVSGRAILPANSTAGTPETPSAAVVQCYSPDSTFTSSRYSTDPRHSWSSSSVSKAAIAASSDSESLSATVSPTGSPVRPQQASVPAAHAANNLSSLSNSPRHSAYAGAGVAVAPQLASGPVQRQSTHAVGCADLLVSTDRSSVTAATSGSSTAAGSSDVTAASSSSTTGATGAAVSAGCGMFGPCYAYIPTQGPSGMMYTVAGPYYYDAGGNLFRLSYT